MSDEPVGVVGLKPSSHYGDRLLSDADRRTALQSAPVLVKAATDRTP